MRIPKMKTTKMMMKMMTMRRKRRKRREGRKTFLRMKDLILRLIQP